MAAKRRKIVAEDIDLGYGATAIPTDSGGSRAASKTGIHTFLPNVFNAKDTCAADGVTDDYAALAAVIEVARTVSSNRGSTVLLPPGNYAISQQLVVPENVILRGYSNLSTRITALGTFPTATALILLGRASETLTHRCRLENLMLDCNGIANSIGVESSKIQELSGLFRVYIEGWKSKGIYIHGVAQNYTLEYLDVIAHAAVNAGGIGIDLDCGAAIFRALRHFTIVGNSTRFATGVRIDNFVSGVIKDANIETCTDGVLVGVTSGGNGLSISNINGQSLTNTVHVANVAMTGIWMSGIAANGTPGVGVQDDRNSVTLASPVPLYVIGGTGAPRTTLAITNAGVQINGQTVYGSLGIGLGGTVPVAKLDVLTTTAVPHQHITTASTWGVTKYLAKVQTTDATPTALFTLSLSDNNSYTISAKVAARSASTGISDGAMVTANYYRNGGGPAAGGAASKAPDFGTYTIAFNVSGNDVRILVTGLAANTINWVADVEVIQVNS